MTEQEWLECADPMLMLDSRRGKVSERKMRMFSCACCRRVLHLVSEEKYLKAIEAAEAFADGLIRKSELLPLRSLGKAKGADRAAILVAVKHASFGTLRSAVSEARWIAADRLYDADYGSALEAEASAQAVLVRDIFGNPFRPVTIKPAWLNLTVDSLATAIYADRAFDRLPILADALEDAGCDNADILNHCRGPGPHVLGCWPLDLVLGKS